MPRRPGAPERPSDAHYAYLDDRCFAVAAKAIEVLEAARVRYVLAGGWAMRPYGSPVPSVDTDVFLPRDSAQRVLDAVAALGITVGEGGQFEPLDLDGHNALLGPDPDFGEPERGYVPADILRGRTHRRKIDLGTFGTPETTVPVADALAFMKLKAYHDRELAWRALRDPAVLAQIPTAERAQVLARDAGYYRRKAGKDLYDLAFLASHENALAGALDIAEATGLSPDLLSLTRSADDALLAFARDVAEREGDTATLAWLRRFTP